MWLVKASIAMTKAATAAKMKRVNKKNAKAKKRLRKAQGAVQKTGVELMATSVNVATQLTQLNQAQQEIFGQIEENKVKQEALNQAVEIIK